MSTSAWPPSRSASPVPSSSRPAPRADRDLRPRGRGLARAGRALGALGLAWALALGPVAGELSAQALAPDAPPPSPAGNHTDRPATVNGQAITSDDIAHHANLLRRDMADAPRELIEHAARRAIGEEILLANEAERLGVELKQRDVDAYWERRLGTTPDYASIAAATGTTEDRQKDLARRAALAEMYLLHKVGLRTEQARKVPPDPQLSRHVALTPSQLREAYLQNKDQLGTPERVVVDLYACLDAARADAAQQALAAGMPVPPTTAQTARRTLPVGVLGQAFPETIANWLGAAKPGDVGRFPVTQGELIVSVLERLPAETPDFAESQGQLRTMLQNELIGEARSYLVAQLRQGATYYPTDLFADKPAAPPEDAAQAKVPVPAAPAEPAPAPATPGAPAEAEGGAPR